ncbi:MAG: iron ABC transporter permease [bacterium]
MRRTPTRSMIPPLLLLILLAALTVLSLCIGPVDIGAGAGAGKPWRGFHVADPRRVAEMLVRSRPADGSDTREVILFELRLPRVITGILVGGCLATAGAIFQGLLRNPLADPFILGVSSGAALGVTLGTLLSLPLVLGPSAVPLLAAAGALAAMNLVYHLSKVGVRLSIYNLIISGVIVNAVGSALIMFLVSLMTRELHGALFWLMGRLDTTTIGMNRALGIVAAAVFAGVMWYSRDLNALVLGEEDAFHLGVNVEWVKRFMFFAASVLTGCAVAGGGIVGFVGLIVPHGARALVGPDHRFVFPAAALMGAALLVAADIGARTLVSPAEIPVGVITALLGGPFFLVLLKRKSRWM